MGASMQYVQDPAVWQTGRLRHGVYMYRGSAQMDIWGVGHLPNCFATKMARTFMPTVFYWLLDYWLQGTILTSYHYFVSFICRSTYNRLQSNYLIPEINSYGNMWHIKWGVYSTVWRWENGFTRVQCEILCICFDGTVCGIYCGYLGCWQTTNSWGIN